MGQGRDQAKQYLRDNKDTAQLLRKKILELNKIGVISSAALIEEPTAAELSDSKATV